MRPSEIAACCIACLDERVKGSGFCAKHKKAHAESKWVSAWKAYQKECVRIGYKKAAWSPP